MKRENNYFVSSSIFEEIKLELYVSLANSEINNERKEVILPAKVSQKV